MPNQASQMGVLEDYAVAYPDIMCRGAGPSASLPFFSLPFPSAPHPFPPLPFSLHPLLPFPSLLTLSLPSPPSPVSLTGQ